MSQWGFWDERQKVVKLKNNADRQRIYPVIFFKMLVLQQLFNLGTDAAFRLQLMKFYPR